MSNNPSQKTPSDRVQACNAESSNKKEEIVYDVGPFDVLMGRGASTTENPGNAHLRQMVVERHSEYIKTDLHREKHRVALGIVRDLEARGGRFLRKVEPIWDKSNHAICEPTTARQLDGEDSQVSPQSTAWSVVTCEKAITGKVKQLLRDMGPEAMSKRLLRRMYRYRKLAPKTDSSADKAGTVKSESPPVSPSTEPSTKRPWDKDPANSRDSLEHVMRHHLTLNHHFSSLTLPTTLQLPLGLRSTTAPPIFITTPFRNTNTTSCNMASSPWPHYRSRQSHTPQVSEEQTHRVGQTFASPQIATGSLEKFLFASDASPNHDIPLIQRQLLSNTSPPNPLLAGFQQPQQPFLENLRQLYSQDIWHRLLSSNNVLPSRIDSMALESLARPPEQRTLGLTRFPFVQRQSASSGYSQSTIPPEITAATSSHDATICLHETDDRQNDVYDNRKIHS